MGKGDKRTRRGKIFKASFGNTRRPRKRITGNKIKAATAAAKSKKKKS